MIIGEVDMDFGASYSGEVSDSVDCQELEEEELKDKMEEEGQLALITTGEKQNVGSMELKEILENSEKEGKRGRS